MHRAAGLVLAVFGLAELVLVALLLDDLSGHGPTAPLVCALFVAVAVSVLLAARRRAPDDPNGARAVLILGAGLAFAALSATALMLSVFSV